MGFIVQLHEELTGDYTGLYFESADLGGEVPRPGDTIISPLSKDGFEPRNPKSHFAFEVTQRVFLPDITGQQSNILKVMVRQRSLTDAEAALIRKS